MNKRIVLSAFIYASAICNTIASENKPLPFKNRTLNVVILSCSGIAFSMLTYYSARAIPQPDSHYSVAYGVVIGSVGAMSSWFLAADNLLELYKSNKQNLPKTLTDRIDRYLLKQ